MSDEQYLLPVRPATPWYRRVPAERWISIAAILVALSAAVFTGWYAWDTHQIRLESQRTGERQNVEIQHSRAASERSAAAAEDALRYTLESGRARLSRTLANVTPLVAGGRPTADFMLTNRGRSTATDIVQETWMEVLDADIDRLPHPPMKALRAQSLAPDDYIVTGIILQKAISGQQISDIRSGVKALYVYGDVKFRDERGDDHTVEWCSEYTTDVPLVFGLLPTCRIHNSSR
jgi:hypothetical protein